MLDAGREQLGVDLLQIPELSVFVDSRALPCDMTYVLRDLPAVRTTTLREADVLQVRFGPRTPNCNVIVHLALLGAEAVQDFVGDLLIYFLHAAEMSPLLSSSASPHG